MKRSPDITGLEWGKIEVVGIGSLRDAKLWPSGGRAWNWKETGTRHKPGIQIADIQELIDNGAEVLVLSRGMDLVLETAPETISFLEREGIEYHVLETYDAVNLYNELAAAGIKVGGLFHSTC